MSPFVLKHCEIHRLREGLDELKPVVNPSKDLSI